MYQMALIKKKKVEPAERPLPNNTFEELKIHLGGPDVNIRRRSARDIVLFDGAAQALFTALEKEQESAVIETIFSTLQTIGTDEVVKGLMLVLRSENAAQRNRAIEVLQTLPDFVSLYIIELLNDIDSDVRIFAIDILQELAHPDTPKWLFSVLKDETHVNVVASAVDRLAEVGTIDMMDEIIFLKKRFPNEHYLHFAIDIALTRIKGH
jgi:HEAT repeat protein